MHGIGIMQGRLSPVIDNKIQAFPSRTWREEFAIASDCGFQMIEWVFDDTEITRNPIYSEQGRAEICKLIEKFNVTVPSICCDYFMAYPLQAKDLSVRLKSQKVLVELIRISGEVGIKYIELPMIGKAGIEEKPSADLILSLLNDISPLLETNGIYILLELSLKPEEVLQFINQISSYNIQINYDTGNSAYWGYDIKKEIPVYGDKIGNVHIKDCTPEDYSVPLGRGNVDFEQSFELLKKAGYSGDFILQTARTVGGRYVDEAVDYFEFTQTLVRKYFP
jgi:L-ribulose-5-phosphate 3-epimerase